MDLPDPKAPAWQDVDDPGRARRGPLRSRVEFHWTWFATVTLLAAALGTRRLPMARPDWDIPTTWLTAIVTALLVGGSLVAHEAGHALAARAFGARTIILRFALAGGAVTTDARQLGARGVAVTALAGPFANLVATVLAASLAYLLDPAAPIGGLLWGTPVVHAGASAGTGAGGRAQSLAFALADAATLNALAGAINLLPIPPFDGGIVVDATVWRYTGRFGAARAISRVVAALLIATGLWLLVAGDVVQGALSATLALLVDRLASSPGRRRR